MNYHKIEKTSIANGTGIRVVLWCSGCRVGCRKCHNPETWDFNSGTLFDNVAKQELFNALNHSYIQGITFSGGHPLEYENLPVVYDLIKEIKNKFPDKDIWLYTGYTLSINDFNTSVDIALDNAALRKYILAMCDVVVDGPFIEAEKDLTIKWCGSRNQRVINVYESLKQNKIVTIQN